MTLCPADRATLFPRVSPRLQAAQDRGGQHQGTSTHHPLTSQHARPSATRPPPCRRAQASSPGLAPAARQQRRRREQSKAEQTHPKQASQPGGITQDPRGGGGGGAIRSRMGRLVDGVPTRLLPSSGTIACRTTGEVQTREKPPWNDRTRTPHGLPPSTGDVHRPPCW